MNVGSILILVDAVVPTAALAAAAAVEVGIGMTVGEFDLVTTEVGVSNLGVDFGDFLGGVLLVGMRIKSYPHNGRG